MLQPIEAMAEWEERGYTENLVLKGDHFEINDGEISIYPEEFEVDAIVRFENTSDPDDQSILYAISSSKHGIKGLFLESFGLYNEDISSVITEKLKEAHRDSSRTL